VDVAPQPIEIALAVGSRNALEFRDGHLRQTRPEGAERLGRSLRRRIDPLPHQEVIEPRRLLREGHLITHFKLARPSLAEQDSEEKVPGSSVRAHQNVSTGWKNDLARACQAREGSPVVAQTSQNDKIFFWNSQIAQLQRPVSGRRVVASEDIAEQGRLLRRVAETVDGGVLPAVVDEIYAGTLG